ncbi:MAG TPA: HAD family hydrolase [Actinomycetota bacterium]|jgi:phosphoglycolate phosphatase-like HAD superfamily hydrolase|nr:HAD family hydrolase [Actinomycetota bacterium]
MTDRRVVLFDVDGTLIDTGGAGGRSWSHAFREAFGVDGDIRRFSEVGMTDPVVARETFEGTLGRAPTTDEVIRLMMRYVLRLPEEVASSPRYRVMPGVHDLLERLVHADTLLGLVTGNIEGAAHIKISRAGLQRFFLFGGYGSDSAVRSDLTRAAIARAEALSGHDIDPWEVIVVGDTPRDIEAAHGAGTVAVGVATGEYSVEQLRDGGADHVLRTFADDPFPSV